MSSQDKNLPYEILTLSHFGFKYCSVPRQNLISTAKVRFSKAHLVPILKRINNSIPKFAYTFMTRKKTI